MGLVLPDWRLVHPWALHPGRTPTGPIAIRDNFLPDLIGGYIFPRIKDIKNGTIATLGGAASIIGSGLITDGSVATCRGTNLSPTSGTEFTAIVRFYYDGSAEFKRLFYSSESEFNFTGVEVQVSSTGLAYITYYDGDPVPGQQSRRTLTSINALSIGWHTMVLAMTSATSGYIFVDGVEHSYTTSGSGSGYDPGSSASTFGFLNYDGSLIYSAQILQTALIFDTVLNRAVARNLSGNLYFNLIIPS